MEFPPSISEILPQRIYLGNLSAALDEQERANLGITHILSVCPEYPSTGPDHRSIPIDDVEYEDILIHLPGACEFIQKVVDEGGKILVHCVMGVSRSATVVAAYLMKSGMADGWVEALELLKEKRPQIHPNYGFIKQLQAFSECSFVPTRIHPAYRAWKRRHRRDVTRYLNFVGDVVTVVRNEVMLASEFPSDAQQIRSLLADVGITHLLIVGPATTPPIDVVGLVVEKASVVCDQGSEKLLDSVKAPSAFLARSVQKKGRVLVLSQNEKEGCIVVCAYLIAFSGFSVGETLEVLNQGLPLFSPSQHFQSLLKQLEANRDLFLRVEPTGSDPPAERKSTQDSFDLQDLQGALATIQEKAVERPQAAMTSSQPQLLSF